MIILSNGDKWILDDSEWEGAGIPYDDAKDCKLPIMSIREFIEKLVVANESDDAYFIPRKWTEFMGGYWDANFDPYGEVFADAAIQTVTNDWSKVYVMPWGHVYVIYKDVDSGGSDACTKVTKLESVHIYIKAALQDLVTQLIATAG